MPPIRLPLTFYNGLAERFVAPYGDDRNDGYDFRYPKATICAAYDSLPATGGTLNIMDGSYIGGSLAKQGFLITAKGTLYPGWRRMKSLRMRGYTGDATTNQLATVGATILPGNPGDSSYYFPPDSQYGIWFTGNGSQLGCPIVIENIIVKGMRGGFRCGGNPNPAVDPYGASGMGSDFTTVLFWLNGCSTQYDGDGNAGNAQPGFHFGYCIWGNVIECASVRPLDAAFTGDRRAGFLVKPSDGSSQIIFDHCRGTQSGIKFYCGSSSWGIDVNWYQIEGDFVNPLPPAVWLIGASKFGSGTITSAGGADGGAGSMNGIKIEATSTFQPSQVVVTNPAGAPDGPCTTLAVNESNSGNITSVDTPAGLGQMSLSGGQFWGNGDFMRQVTPIITNRVRNMCPQHTSSDGLTGPVTNPTIIENSANRVWTQAGATSGGAGSHTVVDSPIADKSGGNTGIQISCNDGGIALQRLFYAYQNVAVGDIFCCGIWVRFPSGPPLTGFPLAMSLTNGALAFAPHQDDLGPTFYGDGQWSFIKGYSKITALNGETQALVNFNVNNITSGHPIVIDQRAIYHIPAGTMSANEFGAFFQNLASYVQAPAGVAATQPGQRLIAMGGIGVGDGVAMGAHTVGATANLLPVRDTDGNLLGYAELKPLTS